MYIIFSLHFSGLDVSRQINLKKYFVSVLMFVSSLSVGIQIKSQSIKTISCLQRSLIKAALHV